ncbi:MAG: hypothetical protein LW875_02170 [Proteobacteria bacterium]|jgi:hypothetical protein|nr:hypothetical protein [Pseudomonadota bacterium]
MRIILVLFVFLLSACNRPDPNPELRDPILTDLKAKLSATDATIEAEEKLIAEFEAALKGAAPQTGQAKIARKRLSGAVERKNRAQQMKQFYMVRIESRTEEAKREYLKAFEAQADWPSPEEYENYKAQDALLAAPKTWSVKERMKSQGASSGTASGSSVDH